MAATVDSDLIAESGLVQDENGISETREFLIKGLTPGSGIRIQGMGAPGFPQYGNVHPNYSGLYATRIQLKPYLNSQNDLVGLVTYQPPDATNLVLPFVQFRGTTKEVLATIDADGNVVEVGYTPTNGPAAKRVVCQFPRTDALGTLTISRVELAIPKMSLKLLNFVNNATFQSQPRRCWWMRDVSHGPFLARPGTYRVDYTIDYRQDTFQEVVTWVDPITGIAPAGIKIDISPDSATGNGWKRVKAKGEANFASLRLPKVF